MSPPRDVAPTSIGEQEATSSSGAPKHDGGSGARPTPYSRMEHPRMQDTPPPASTCQCSCHIGGRFATCNIPEGCAHLHPGNHADSPVVPELDQARPSSACTLCPPPGPSRKAWTPARRGYVTCDDCYLKVRDHLIDVRDRYARLDATPGANLEHGSRGAPGFGSKPTASLHVVTMRDWRSLSCETAKDDVAYIWDGSVPNAGCDPLSPGEEGPERPPGAYVQRREVWRGGDGRAHSEQENPPRSVPKVLAGWCDVVAGERDMTPPGTRDVAELVRWIDNQLDWVTRNDIVVDLDADLRALVAQLRPVTGDPGRRAIGLCPNTLDAGPSSRECGAKLFAPLKGDAIECGACRRVWTASEWLKLGELLGEAS